MKQLQYALQHRAVAFSGLGLLNEESSRRGLAAVHSSAPGAEPCPIFVGSKYYLLVLTFMIGLRLSVCSRVVARCRRCGLTWGS